MATVTALVLTLNEEEMLPYCLDRLLWADEILVVDSGSTDKTVQIARAAGARVEYHEFRDFSEQCNWGVQEAKSEWIFLVDADEVVTVELAASVRRTLAGDPETEIFEVCRDACALGRFMKATSWSNEWIPRLFRKDAVVFEGEVHQDPNIGDRKVGRLSGKLLHYSYRSMEQYFKKSSFYATLWTKKAMAKGRRTGLAKAIASTTWRMFHNYFIRGEIRDGRMGLAMTMLAGMHTFARHMKLWGMQNAEEFARIPLPEQYAAKEKAHDGKQPPAVEGRRDDSENNHPDGPGGGGEG